MIDWKQVEKDIKEMDKDPIFHAIFEQVRNMDKEEESS